MENAQLHNQLTQIKEEADTCVKNTALVERERDRLKSRATTLQHTNDALESEMAENDERLDAAETQLAASKSEVASLKQLLKAKEAEIGRLNELQVRCHTDRQTSAADIKRLRETTEGGSAADMDALRAELTTTQEELEAAQQNLAHADEDCTTINTELNVELAHAKFEARKAQEALQLERDSRADR